MIHAKGGRATPQGEAQFAESALMQLWPCSTRTRCPFWMDFVFWMGRYFKELAASDKVSLEVRCFACATLAELGRLKAANRWLTFFQAYAVIDTAFERYRSEHNARVGVNA